MKAIISTGQGRLHLIESAVAIKKAGAKVDVITGWIPSKFIPDGLINLLGRFAGRKNISYGLKKRRPEELLPQEIKSCAFSEFFIQILFLLSRLKIMKRDMAAVMGWKLYGRQTRKYINDAQIFHVRSGAGQGGAIKKARSLGMKIVVDHSIAHPKEVNNQLIKSHGGNADLNSFSPKSKFWLNVLKDCEQADVIQVNSEYVKDSFIKNGFSSNKIAVVNLGVRDDFFGLKNNYSSSHLIKLLFTGGFGRRKGGHLIIDSISNLIRKEKKFQLDIIGSIMSDFEIPAWFTNHPGINLYGHLPQDKLKAYLAKADIYVFPSYSEGAAQSLKEAMAAGLPVIATRQSGAPIVHGENGWLIPDDSADALTDAILHLSNNADLRKKMGLNAANTIAADHTWEKYGEKVVNLYNQLMDKHKNE